MNKNLPVSLFIVSQILILTSGLIFLAGLYYVLNIQYQPKKIYSKLSGPVTTPPRSLRIELQGPDEDTLSFDSSIIVSGQTGPNLYVLISTDSEDSVIRSKPDGSFSTIINLSEGVNKLTAAVFDATGDSRFSERTVYYSKEKI